MIEVCLKTLFALVCTIRASSENLAVLTFVITSLHLSIMAVSSGLQKASTSASATSSEAKQKKSPKSAVGAPSQRTQASRKGKKAWRKNIDIDDVEERLEELRVEERVTG